MKWILLIMWFNTHHILLLEQFATAQACTQRAVEVRPIYFDKANIMCSLAPMSGTKQRDGDE